MHGTVPLDFGKGIVIPLIKNLDGDKTSCDNYRGITLRPVVSKLFELVLMNDLQSYLQSDELQLGFKRNSGCSHAIFALRSVIPVIIAVLGQQLQSVHLIFQKHLIVLIIINY